MVGIDAVSNLGCYVLAADEYSRWTRAHCMKTWRQP